MNKLPRFLKSPYIIAAIVVFVLLMGIGLYLKFSFSDALFASAVLTVIGVGGIWWKTVVW
jgi:hypothetical protein